MGVLSWLKRQLGIGTERSSNPIPGRPESKSEEIVDHIIDSSIASNILVLSSDEAQRDKVLMTAKWLWQLWVDEENRDILRTMVRVKSAYPHLARMAEVEYMSPDWLSELATATEKTTQGIEELKEGQDQILEILEDLNKQEK